ncbi:hypothetical protein ACFYYL_08885 [Actinomadura geliboluensis]|uniref:hypothetical protein n=1 Tax=Actinomadura geliboluensis TaxID=882440 RepID=UPI0036CF4AD9
MAEQLSVYRRFRYVVAGLPARDGRERRLKKLRLLVAVREGDWATFHGPFSARLTYRMRDIAAFSLTAAVTADMTERWRELDRAGFGETVRVAVPPRLPIAELTSLALAAARKHGLAQPDDGRRPRYGGDTGPLFSRYGSLIRVWLHDTDGERYPEDISVGEAGLCDGDTVVLSIEREAGGAYSVGPAPDPQALFRSLQLGSRSPSPRSLPRLWGILLYTDADVELATYVRTHFDELNALSGPIFRLFVLERPSNWSATKRYWRDNLEPELYRVFNTLRWLKWKPYERHRAYDIARTLGIDPDLLPCLALVRGDAMENRIVFPINEVSATYLRKLFGEILRALDAPPEPYSIAEALYPFEENHPSAVYGDAVENDQAAFERVARAEERIRRSLARPLFRRRENKYILNGHTAIVESGASMVENFNFHGQTTFINRPVDTVIQDFQNTHSALAGQEHLAELLRLVLSSADLPDEDKEEAANVIQGVAVDLDRAEPDQAGAKTKLEMLRTGLAQAADIAGPASTILASILGALGA